jgi:outer membrane protein TolC
MHPSIPHHLARVLVALALPIPALAAQSAPLTLDEALKIAESRSSQLAAQRAAAEASASLATTAGELPDPKLIVGIENAPVEGPDKWSLTADGMTMRRIGVMQDFVRGEKRELMATRAQAEAHREAALVAMQAAEIRKEVAMAWFDRLYAERSLALVDALAAETDLQVAGTTAQLAAGRMGTADPLMAKGQRAALADRRLEIERMARRAEARLARWLGEDARRAPAGEPDIAALPVNVAKLTTDLENHPQLAMFAPMTAAAEAEAKLAAIATQPDYSVELSYGARGAAYTNMVSLMFRMDLPVFAGTRQEPAALARLKQAEQARAQAEEARRRYESEVRAALADYDIARARVERNEKEIVPLAEERAKAALAAYEGGRAELGSVLEARRMLLEARLMALGVRAEAARAWAGLAYLVAERSPQ